VDEIEPFLRNSLAKRFLRTRYAEKSTSVASYHVGAFGVALLGFFFITPPFVLGCLSRADDPNAVARQLCKDGEQHSVALGMGSGTRCRPDRPPVVSPTRSELQGWRSTRGRALSPLSAV
jgi:hypothetical protein